MQPRKKIVMKKRRHTRENGITMSPYPLYPGEVRDDKETAGKFKNNERSTHEISLTSKKASDFSYRLIAKNLAGY